METKSRMEDLAQSLDGILDSEEFKAACKEKGLELSAENLEKVKESSLELIKLYSASFGWEMFSKHLSGDPKTNTAEVGFYTGIIYAINTIEDLDSRPLSDYAKAALLDNMLRGARTNLSKANLSF